MREDTHSSDKIELVDFLSYFLELRFQGRFQFGGLPFKLPVPMGLKKWQNWLKINECVSTTDRTFDLRDKKLISRTVAIISANYAISQAKKMSREAKFPINRHLFM